MTNIHEEFATMTKRREDLSNRKARIDFTIEEAKKRHASLCEQAREKYGVSTLDELRAKLVAMKQENSEAISAFKAALDVTEKKVVEAETIIAAASSGVSSGARA